MNRYVSNERLRHAEHRRRGLTPESGVRPGMARDKVYDFVLPFETKQENLDPHIREQTARYFAHHRITWHTMAHHMLSSQVCCLNHLMPLAHDKDALRALFLPVLGAEIEFLPLPGEDPSRKPCFLGFEYFGQRDDDFLKEGDGKPLTKGANCTSCDAVVRIRNRGRTELILIEWKYTESYANHGPRKGDETREGRYRHLLEAADSPIQPTAIPFQSFLVDPFYQFMRQQLLAHEMEKAQHLDAEIVRVLHIAPAANLAFKRIKVPAFQDYGATPVEAWRSLLRNPDRFISVHSEDLFGGIVDANLMERIKYARNRYDFGRTVSTTQSFS